MPNAEDIRWFKSSWGPQTVAALQGTPFAVDQVIAIACQETGYIWSKLRRAGLPPDQVAALCVGDTIDYKAPGKGRQAFPKTKADLLAQPHGAEMFAIARAALEAIALHDTGYAKAATNPDKFCHGYGVFQRDLQFFKDDPDYFLTRSYADYPKTLAHCIAELQRGRRALKLPETAVLSDDDFCKVAIAYNTGGYKAAKGLKQGFFDGEKYYGEWIADYLAQVRATGPVASVPAAAKRFKVIARDGLRLRSGPGTGHDILRVLPTGTEVTVLKADAAVPAWVYVDLQGDGLADGCVLSSFLAPLGG